MRLLIRRLAGCGLVALLAALFPLVASAHEHRDVANGQYSMVVGFLNEPAIAGDTNGLDLRVSKPTAGAASPAAGASDEDEEEAGTPVEGLADTLKAEVIYGDQKMDLTLQPVFQQPGAYEAIFIPTAAGDYTFHIYGQIEGTNIDESFTSSPTTFDSVAARENYEFPKQQSGSVGGAAATIGGAGFPGGSDDFPGGPGGGLLAGLALAVGGGLVLAGRAATRRRALAPAAARA